MNMQFQDFLLVWGDPWIKNCEKKTFPVKTFHAWVKLTMWIHIAPVPSDYQITS